MKTMTTAPSQPFRNGQRGTTQDLSQSVSIGLLEDILGFRLRMTQLAFSRQAALISQRIGVSTAVFSLLLIVHENPGIRQGILGETLLIKRSNLTKVVQNLVNSGLILREASSTDKRSTLLTLSSEGEEFVAKHRNLFIENDASVWQKALTVHERNLLHALLVKLHAELVLLPDDGLIDEIDEN